LEAKFSDPTGSDFKFTDKRDGNKGYQMFSISTRMEGAKLAYYYKKVSQYIPCMSPFLIVEDTLDAWLLKQHKVEIFYSDYLK
jgi:hypothetical protein